MTVADDRLADRRRLAATTVQATQAVWEQLDPDDVERSWPALVAPLTVLVARGQQAAAAGADLYVDEATEPSEPAGRVVAGSLSGVASDGRPLDTLFDAAPLRTLRARSTGATAAQASAAGLAELVMLAATQVHDAGRVADSVAMTTRPIVTGWRRTLRQPSCARCIVLAGRFYRWNDGFLRHPRCDCVHEPATRGDQPRTDDWPRQVFDSMSARQQDRTFTKAGAQAIRDGADVRQVVNARRGMKTTRAYGRDISTTTVGTTDTALAGRRIAESGAEFVRTRSVTSTTPQGARRTRRRVDAPRLMPEQIYADAVDRDDAIRLLRRFGFIV